MMRLEEDLARWEAGELSVAQVEARHPGAGVSGLVSLHERLAALEEQLEPVAAHRAWEAILEHLADLEPVRDRFLPRVSLRARMLRSVAAVAAALLLLAGVFYAAGVEPVRTGVDRAVRVVRSLFVDDDPPAPKAPPRVRDRRDTDRDSSGPGSAEDGEDDGDGDDDRSGPAGRREDEDEPEEEDRSGPSGDDDGSAEDGDRSGTGGGQEADEPDETAPDDD